MGKSLSTTFTQANGVPAQIAGGPAWEAISGTAPTVSSNELLFSTAGSSNPIYGVNVGVRMNGKNDVDASMLPKHVYGNALYVRVVDANNWVRARVFSDSYDNYATEYEYWDTSWYDRYKTGTYQRQVRLATTTYTYNVPAWPGSWSNTGETTACRIGTPTYGLESQYTYGYESTRYRWVSNGLGVGCAADKATYRKQSQSRTITQNASTSYSYRYENDGYVLQANENFTGSTQIMYSPSWAYQKVGTNQNTASNPGQTTSANGTYDLYDGTTGVASSTYYAQSPRDAHDATLATGNSRQTYTGTSYYYGYVYLEKCVAGSITNLGSYYSGSSTPQALRLRAKDSTLEVYYGGTLRITATDATHVTGPKIGVGGGSSPYNSTVARVDDFAYTILTPYRVRNAADTAWINVERPKIRNAANTAWIDYDPKDY